MTTYLYDLTQNAAVASASDELDDHVIDEFFSSVIQKDHAGVPVSGFAVVGDEELKSLHADDRNHP